MLCCFHINLSMCVKLMRNMHSNTVFGYIIDIEAKYLKRTCMCFLKYEAKQHRNRDLEVQDFLVNKSKIL